MITLYGVDKKGSYKVWSIWAVDNTFTVEHGKLKGKLQQKVFTVQGKNIGKANQTTPQQQAVFDMESRVRKQWDKGYRYTLEDAVETSKKELLPMLASDYTKVGHNISYPCLVSSKLDGVRCIARIVEGEVTLTSRGGKPYPVPEHIAKDLLEIHENTNIDCFDGELYIHGVSLQNIVSAVKKPNELTPSLQFWIFDIPSEEPFHERLRELDFVSLYKYRNNLTALNVVQNHSAINEEEAREHMDYLIQQGFEGLMLRNLEGKYEWNHRSRDLQKWKDFQDIELPIVSYEVDNLGEAVYLMQLPNGLVCKAKPRGSHEYRSVNNVSHFLDNWGTVRFQQYTDDGNLQFPVLVGVRECDEFGNPVE